MPPRSTPPPKGSFYPANDAATHRDLLLFEERLKTMADSLQRRKFRYQLFLTQLLVVIVFLLSEVRLHTSFLAIPYKFILQKTLPDIYTDETEVALHPYFASGLLFVSVTTLVLFFASGMYTEKVAYANRYVPHANKALRSFNMYLNVRRPPLRSKVPFNPFAFFFPRPPPPPPLSPNSSRMHSMHSVPRPDNNNNNNNNNALTNSTSSPTSSDTIPVPIAPIPPTTNPRGELIFSSRVDKSFRESYARHRAAFERRRDELERIAKARTWIGWFLLKMPWSKGLPLVTTPLPPLGGSNTNTPSPGGSRALSVSSRGRGGGGSTGGAVPTPTGSRRSSPMPERMGFAGS